MTPTQCLYGFRSVLRIKRDCFPLYNRSSKQSYSVEERNKICKQHSASCLNGVSRISVPKNGELHEALASLHGIILCNVKTWQPLFRFMGMSTCSMWVTEWSEYWMNTSVLSSHTHTHRRRSYSHCLTDGVKRQMNSTCTCFHLLKKFSLTDGRNSP